MTLNLKPSSPVLLHIPKQPRPFHNDIQESYGNRFDIVYQQLTCRENEQFHFSLLGARVYKAMLGAQK